ncbi:MAG: hypothetical protein Q9218_006605 [Villophora microphyllina]
MYSLALDKMYQIQELSAALPFALSIGFPIDDIPRDSEFLQDSYDFLKWTTVSQALAWCSVMAVKFSFLFLFRKLIDRMPPLITYWCFVIAFNIITLGYGMSTYFLYCPYFNDPKLYECGLPSGVARETRLGIAQTTMDVVGDLLITRVAGIRRGGDQAWQSYFLIVSAEVGIILASVSTYRAFFVSRQRGDFNGAERSPGHQEHRYSPTRFTIKRFFTSSPWRPKAREPPSPRDNWEDGDEKYVMGSLPQIPRAHLTGVRTFIDGNGRVMDNSPIMESQGIEEIDDDWPLHREEHKVVETV